MNLHLTLLSLLLYLVFTLCSHSAAQPDQSTELSITRVADDPTPIQQRIALLPSGMTVSWSTVGPLSTLPTVSYGLTPSSLTSQATGYSLYYTPSITHFHHVVIKGLQANTRYHWQVTSPKGVNSSILSFITAPKAGDPTPFTVAINGNSPLHSLTHPTPASPHSPIPSSDS